MHILLECWGIIQLQILGKIGTKDIATLRIAFNGIAVDVWFLLNGSVAIWTISCYSRTKDACISIKFNIIILNDAIIHSSLSRQSHNIKWLYNYIFLLFRANIIIMRLTYDYLSFGPLFSLTISQ